MSWKKRTGRLRFTTRRMAVCAIRPFVALLVSREDTSACPRGGNGSTTNGLPEFIDLCQIQASSLPEPIEPGGHGHHGSLDRPCGQLSALHPLSTRALYLFHAQHARLYSRSHAAFLVTSRRTLGVLSDWYSYSQLHPQVVTIPCHANATTNSVPQLYFRRTRKSQI